MAQAPPFDEKFQKLLTLNITPTLTLNRTLILIISENNTTNENTAATKRASEALLENYLSFTSLLTVTVLKKVLAEFDPVTKYLQTRGLDMNQAIQMTEFDKKAVLTYRSKHDDFYEEARVFQSKVQECIDTNTSEEFDVTS